jgi:hypothetical protein
MHVPTFWLWLPEAGGVLPYCLVVEDMDNLRLLVNVHMPGELLVGGVDKAVEVM